MKKIYFLICSIPLFMQAQIQLSAIDYLDTNNVKAAILCNADFGWDLSNSQYEVPKGSGKHPLFCGSLWIGGYHNGSLRMAANTYRQTGMDFWPGPLDTTNASITIPVSNQWNKLWKIGRGQIEQFIQQWNLGNVQNGSFIPPQVILTWPAHGTGNLSKYLAPFVDKNGDGLYNPVQDGDYPLMKGDQMIWWVINDALAAHGETGAAQIGVEIHCSAYSYHRPCIGKALEALNNTTYYNYKIINRSPDVLDSAVVGFFIDSDLGNFADDYVGCNVGSNLAFTYNANISDAVYGPSPPAFSLLTLKGPTADLDDGIDNDRDSCIDCSWSIDTSDCSKDIFSTPIADETYPETIAMSSFMYMDNTTTSFYGGHYKMLNALWNSVHLTYGGNGTNSSNAPCTFAFPGYSDPNGWGLGYQPGSPPIIPPGGGPWTEHDLARTPGDRKMYIGMGRFTLKPNSYKEVDMALVFSRDSANCSNNLCALAVAEADADTLQKLFTCSHKFPSCSSGIGISEIKNNGFNIYPNPVYNYLNIELHEAALRTTIEITDVLGKKVGSFDFTEGQKHLSIPVENLSKGVYTVKVRSGNSYGVKKFIKD